MNNLVQHGPAFLRVPRESFFAPFEQVFDQLMNEFHTPAFFDKVRSNSGFPKMNISRRPSEKTSDGEDFVISVNVAGVEAEDLKIETEEDIVRISGRSHTDTNEEGVTYYVTELTQKQFCREVRLPDYIERFDEPEGTVKNGVLTLRWPIRRERVVPKTKTITIKQE